MVTKINFPSSFLAEHGCFVLVLDLSEATMATARMLMGNRNSAQKLHFLFILRYIDLSQLVMINYNHQESRLIHIYSVVNHIKLFDIL